MEYDPFSYEVHEDPYPFYRWLREEAPVWRNERLGFWTLARFDDVLGAALDTRRFSSAHGVTLEGDTGQPMLITMDPPEHTVMRSLVSRAFTPARIAQLEDTIRQRARSYLEPLVEHGTADVVTDFSARLPIDIIGELMGLPGSVRDAVRDATGGILHREPDQHGLSDVNARAGQDLAAIIAEQLAWRRTRRTDDVLGILLQAEITDQATGETKRLSDEELIGFGVLLAVAGSETVTKLIANSALALHQFPDQRSRLLERRDEIRNAVEEALRWDGPTQYDARFTHEDVVLHGVTIPAGEFVLLLFGAANRDPREFPDPDQFDAGRNIDRHLGFGFGPHVCLGAALARMETKIAIEELLRLFPDYEVDEEQAVRMHNGNVRGFASLPIAFTPRTLARSDV